MAKPSEGFGAVRVIFKYPKSEIAVRKIGFNGLGHSGGLVDDLKSIWPAKFKKQARGDIPAIRVFQIVT